MNVIAAALEIVKGNGGVAAIVGARVATLVAPQSWDPPFVVLSFPSSVPDHSMEGPSGYAETLVQADCYGGDSVGGMKQSSDLAKAVRVALDNFTGTLAGVDINGVELEQQFPDYDEERQQRRIVQTYRVMHNE